MPRTGRATDFLEDYHLQKDRIRRLEMRNSGGSGQVESFIMDPVSVRPWPAGLALSMTISGVMLYLGSGGPVSVDFNYSGPSGSGTLHSFFDAASGTVLSAQGADMDIGGELQLDIGDIYWPEITDGSGGNITAGFITVPS